MCWGGWEEFDREKGGYKIKRLLSMFLRISAEEAAAVAGVPLGEKKVLSLGGVVVFRQPMPEALLGLGDFEWCFEQPSSEACLK